MGQAAQPEAKSIAEHKHLSTQALTDSAAEVILKLCNLSEKERREMGRRGYEYVMKHHSVPVLAKKLLEVMEDVKRD